jgi:hypothetical protein
VTGDLLSDKPGVRSTWFVKLGEDNSAPKANVTTTVHLLGEFELRVHEINAPAETVGKFDLLEGSYALGLMAPEDADEETGDSWRSIRSRSRGAMVAAWALAGYNDTASMSTFEPDGNTRINLVYPHVAVATLAGALSAAQFTLASLYYASAKPLDAASLQARAAEISKQYRSGSI